MNKAGKRYESYELTDEVHSHIPLSTIVHRGLVQICYDSRINRFVFGFKNVPTTSATTLHFDACLAAYRGKDTLKVIVRLFKLIIEEKITLG